MGSPTNITRLNHEPKGTPSATLVIAARVKSSSISADRYGCMRIYL
jgi:hypothetical protein